MEWRDAAWRGVAWGLLIGWWCLGLIADMSAAERVVWTGLLVASVAIVLLEESGLARTCARAVTGKVLARLERAAKEEDGAATLFVPVGALALGLGVWVATQLIAVLGRGGLEGTWAGAALYALTVAVVAGGSLWLFARWQGRD